jgi:hypothetical protein
VRNRPARSARIVVYAMIVEPVSTNARSRRRRLAARLLLVVPVLLLAGVIGLGVLGGGDGDHGTIAQAIPTTPMTATARPSIGPTAAPSPSAATSLVGTQDSPTQLDGLRVRSVTEVLAERAAGALDPPMPEIAIAGWLGVPNPPVSCDMLNRGAGPLGVLGPLCTRDALLAAYQWTDGYGDAFAGIGPHIHARFPQGVLLPDGIERTTDEIHGRPIASVLFGTYQAPPPKGCRVLEQECDGQFVVDSVGWAEATDVLPATGLVVGRGAPTIR